MPSPMTPGLTSGRLPADQIARNFADLHAPFDGHEAAVAADRCYFCFDAPCVTACPTAIDIPLFIRQIQTGTPEAAAKTIFDQNILGGMCARVCPTETLCEEACVREAAEGKPVEIGRLQRHATDTLMAKGVHPYIRAPETGKVVAVFGAGPAGLACAHRLAMYGHKVELYDARPNPGGLNEYGIAAYKTVGGYAQAEVDWLMKIGGITLHVGNELTGPAMLAEHLAAHSAVFLAIGLGGVNALRLPGEDLDGVQDAVRFIAGLRQSDLTKVPVGRNVVVIGGGMTAIDAAVQSKLLGAETVTVLYRRSREEMPASRYEQDLAASKGVRLIFNAMPMEIVGQGKASTVRVEYTKVEGGRVVGTGETFEIAADHVLKAIGQTLEGAPEGLEITGGKIAVTGAGRTSLAGVWAGGDCATGGDDLTVTAVAEGRDAAEDIHASLMR